MKKLIITRHAKSDWSNLSLSDFDRKLNERGLTDAPKMGKRLLQRNISISLILSSTALRAAETAQLIANEIGYDIERMQWVDELYHASTQTITDQIEMIEDEFESVMLVCHNPGITHFVNSQCGFITDNVPTCGIAAFEIQTDRWSDFRSADKQLIFYDFPKNH